MKNFNIGDLVIVINSEYNEKLIGCSGTIQQVESFIEGIDKNGKKISGYYLVVDLQDIYNRFGTTLWYFKSSHLIKITPEQTAEIPAVSAFRKINCY